MENNKHDNIPTKENPFIKNDTVYPEWHIINIHIP